MPVDNAWLSFPANEKGGSGGEDLDVVEFDGGAEVEGAAGGFLAVDAVAGVAEKRGGQQAVADRVADATAC